MSLLRIASILLTVLLAGCSATQRYKWNIEHAHVSPDEHLTRLEVEQIVRAVSEASSFPIICISRGGGEYSNQITVFTDLEHNPDRFMDYDLQKKSDGLWHIISSGKGSIIVCD